MQSSVARRSHVVLRSTLFPGTYSTKCVLEGLGLRCTFKFLRSTFLRSTWFRFKKYIDLENCKSKHLRPTNADLENLPPYPPLKGNFIEGCKFTIYTPLGNCRKNVFLRKKGLRSSFLAPTTAHVDLKPRFVFLGGGG